MKLERLYRELDRLKASLTGYGRDRFIYPEIKRVYNEINMLERNR